MKATTLPEQPDAKSPAGAEIRFLLDGEMGNLIRSMPSSPGDSEATYVKGRRQPTIQER